jgi:hypothetical protein
MVNPNSPFCTTCGYQFATGHAPVINQPQANYYVQQPPHPQQPVIHQVIAYNPGPRDEFEWRMSAILWWTATIFSFFFTYMWLRLGFTFMGLIDIGLVCVAIVLFGFSAVKLRRLYLYTPTKQQCASMTVLWVSLFSLTVIAVAEVRHFQVRRDAENEINSRRVAPEGYIYPDTRNNMQPRQPGEWPR